MIRATSKNIISVTVEGKTTYLSRYCTHEGADLSLGYIDDEGNLRCPWHNLYFDPSTGEQPCKSLKNLKKYKTENEEPVSD